LSARPRIGVVGLNHGYALARAIKSCPAVELVALCTRSPDKHRMRAREFNVPLFGQLDSMLAECALDGVVVAGPTDQLVAMTLCCLAHDVSVLVEKPLGTSVSEALELKHAVARTRARVVVGYYRRLARQVVALKGLLESGVIGEMTGVCCKWVIRKPVGYFQDWKAARSRGGGFLMINTIHDLDLLQFLLGRIVAVAAMQCGSNNTDDVEHAVALAMRFSGGQIGTAFFADQNPSPYSYDNTVAAVSKFPVYPADSHHFFGTAGSLAFPSFTVHSERSTTSSWLEPLNSEIVSSANHETDDPIALEIERFGQVLSSGAQPHATIADAIQNLSVVEAIRRSLHSGAMEPVRLLVSGL
jgi:predicted dehydrogenase